MVSFEKFYDKRGLLSIKRPCDTFLVPIYPKNPFNNFERRQMGFSNYSTVCSFQTICVFDNQIHGNTDA
jgi:hypothetical protein